MTTPDVDSVGFALAPMATISTLPGSPTANMLQPNSVARWGTNLTKKARAFISPDRMARPSTTVDLDSGAEITMDVTSESLRLLMEYAMMAAPVGVERSVFYPSAVTSTGYTVATGGDIADGRLFFASGLGVSGNNGLKLAAGTSTTTEIKTTGLTAETGVNSGGNSGQNATLEICGVQGASGDFRLNAAGNLTSESGGLDFTTMPWVVGQILHVGDPDSGAAYRPDSITDAMYDEGHGFVRIRSISAHLVTFDKNDQLVTNGADTAAGKTIRVLYGPMLREWADDHANFRQTYQYLEAAFPDLDGGTDAYEYSTGNLLSSLKIDFGLTEFVTMTATWVGTDTAVPTTTRVSWANLRQCQMEDTFTTTTSWRRRRICTRPGVSLVNIALELKDASLTISNGITPEKVQGGRGTASRLGAFKLNKGDRMVTWDSTWLYEEPDAQAAIRNNDRLTGDFAMGGDQGGFYIDLPALKLGDGAKGLERHTSVTQKLSIMVERDPELGYMMSFTRFPYLP